MPFQKGHKINQGHKRALGSRRVMSEEHKNKISQAHKGMKKPWVVGHSVSEETKDKLRELNRLGIVGMKGRYHSEESKRRISEGNKGRKITIEHIEKLRVANTGRAPWNKGKVGFSYGLKGEYHPFWKGGVTPLFKKIRKSKEYIIWRVAVFTRDDYTCQICKQKGGQLQADHIKPFADYPELRFAIDNGRTLCISCHRKTETWGFNIKNGNYPLTTGKYLI